MYRILAYIALAAIIWSSCKADEPGEDMIETPVFKVQIQPGIFNPDADSAAYVAGVDGIYLFTGVKRENDQVLVMSGAFASVNCPTGDCPGSVRFEFRNENEGNMVEPDSLFFSDQLWVFKSPFQNPPYFHTVKIHWVTPDGRTLLSDVFPQDSSTFFRVLNPGPWESNEKGEKTWKMSIDFSCIMLDSLSSNEQPVRGSGVIAVAYK